MNAKYLEAVFLALSETKDISLGQLNFCVGFSRNGMENNKRLYKSIENSATQRNLHLTKLRKKGKADTRQI